MACTLICVLSLVSQDAYYWGRMLKHLLVWLTSCLSLMSREPVFQQTVDWPIHGYSAGKVASNPVEMGFSCWRTLLPTTSWLTGRGTYQEKEKAQVMSPAVWWNHFWSTQEELISHLATISASCLTLFLPNRAVVHSKLVKLARSYPVPSWGLFSPSLIICYSVW